MGPKTFHGLFEKHSNIFKLGGQTINGHIMTCVVYEVILWTFFIFSISCVDIWLALCEYHSHKHESYIHLFLLLRGQMNFEHNLNNLAQMILLHIPSEHLFNISNIAKLANEVRICKSSWTCFTSSHIVQNYTNPS